MLKCKARNCINLYWHHKWWTAGTSFLINNRFFRRRAEQPGRIWRLQVYGIDHSLDVEDLSHQESNKVANKVEDDSDGHELRHFKQACETQAAASLEFCLSD